MSEGQPIDQGNGDIEYESPVTQLKKNFLTTLASSSVIAEVVSSSSIATPEPESNSTSGYVHVSDSSRSDIYRRERERREKEHGDRDRRRQDWLREVDRSTPADGIWWDYHVFGDEGPR